MAEKAKSHANRLVAESENGVITSVQLKEHYADLCQMQLSLRSLFAENSSSFYSMAKGSCLALVMTSL